MFVVLFSTTERDDVDLSEYRGTSARMHELVSQVPGFISYNSYGSDDGPGVAVVRFDSEEALKAWRTLPEHRAAQEQGREAFYEEYWVQVCETVREYRFTREGGYEHDLRRLFVSGSVIPPAAVDR